MSLCAALELCHAVRMQRLARRFWSSWALAATLACRSEPHAAIPGPEAPAVAAPALPSSGAADAPLSRSIAMLAGGCFWGMEELLRTLPGVTNTVVGYTGGGLKNPVYEDVHTGTT